MDSAISSTSRGLEEDKGVLKSGLVVAAYAPVKSKKSYYAVLSERALELHDTEKMYRKKKQARHLMDLSVAFNVHNDHLDPKLKHCVCVMGPDETLCLKAESRQQNAEWHDAILRAIVPSRAYKLCRPVQLSEFFEFAWDVDIVVTPKLKRALNSSERLPSMVDRHVGLEPGRRRLCFYPHTIILCKRKIEPATTDLPPSGIPPFSMDNFIELPRMFVAFYGSQERYFLIKMGRGSPSGACELWLQCESDEVANEVHLKLNYIIERETEKKKKMNGGDVTSVLPILRNHHRERSHTQPQHMRTASNGQRICSPAQSTSMIGRKASTSSSTGGSLSARCATVSHGSPHGSPQTAKNNIQNNSNPMWSVFPPQQRRSSNSASIKEEPSTSSSVYQEMAPTPSGRTGSQPAAKSTAPSRLAAAPSSNSGPCTTGGSTSEETEDSGGTLRLDNNSFRGDANGSTRSSQHSLIIAEAIIEHHGKESSVSDMDELGSVGGVSGLSGPSSGSVDPSDTQDDEYTPMDHADWNLLGGSNSRLVVPTQYDRDRYNLEEVRSYVSDSSDSCYSSMAANSTTNGQNGMQPGNPPRAYSFGGHGNLKPSSVHPQSVTSPVESVAALDGGPRGENVASIVHPNDDPRKRAFSLGSKSFFQRPFRKTSSHVNRQQRHSQTSASGASLASSAASSFGQSSSSTNHLATIAGEKEDYARNRSGSFGSGRSTPYTRRGGGVGGSGVTGNEHHVEMDFSGLGRSGSGSVASVDSPSRSRTSSFGGRKDDLFAFAPSSSSDHNEHVLLLSHEKPSQKILQMAQQNSRDGNDSGDYVLTEAPSEKDQLAMQMAQLQDESNGFPSPPESSFKSMDIRCGQVIETIQENTSERSSRSASQSSLVPPECEDDYSLMSCGPSTSSPSGPVPERTTEGTRPDRAASSPVPEVLLPPSGLPKRSSVPSMSSHENCDEQTALNYACLQIHDDSGKPASLPGECLLSGSAHSSRTRSKSGIVFTKDTPAPHNNQPLDYATVKPL